VALLCQQLGEPLNLIVSQLDFALKSINSLKRSV